jgi:hypothetical protein
VDRPPSPYSVEGSLKSCSYTHVSPPDSPSAYHYSPEPVEASDSDWGSDNEVWHLGSDAYIVGEFVL